jgi:hypothetical protein
MTLDWRTAEQQVYLIVIISEPSEVFDDSKRGLPVCDSGVHVMLLAILINAETLEGQVAPRTKLWLNRSWLEDW